VIGANVHVVGSPAAPMPPNARRRLVVTRLGQGRFMFDVSRGTDK